MTFGVYNGTLHNDIPAPVSYTGPLDIVPGAVVAFGQRALSAAKRGTALYTIADGAGGATQSFNSDATTGVAPISAIQSYSATPFVQTWNDQSGNGNNATNTIGAGQPSWVSNLQGGRSGLIFAQPSAQVLLTQGNVATGTAGLTIFAVGTLGGIGTPTGNFFTLNNLTTDALLLYSNQGNGDGLELDVFSAIDNLGLEGDLSNTWATQVAIVEVVVNSYSDLSVDDLLVNGVTVYNQSNSFPATSFAGQTGILALGSNAGQNFPVSGLAEIIIYTSGLSLSNRIAIRQNIAAYYGIVLS